MPAPSTNPTRHRRRTARIAVLSLVGVVTIGWASMLALVGLALPWIASHPDRIAAALGERLGRPIHFDRLATRWEPTGPVFTLSGVRIGDGAAGFSVPQAEWALDFYAWLRRGVAFSEFRLSGLDLEVFRDAGGDLRVRGLGAGPAPVDLDLVLDLTALAIEASRVRVVDATRGIDWRLSRLDARVRNEAGVRLIGVEAWASESGPPLRVACRRDPDVVQRCFARGDGLALADWLAGLPLGGVAASAGRVDLRAWFDVGERLEHARVRLSGRRVAVHGASPGLSSGGAPAWAWFARERMELDARVVALDSGWHLEAVDRPGADATAPGSRLAWTRIRVGGRPVDRVLADRLDLGLVGALAAMTDLDPQVRGALIEARPRGVLTDLSLLRLGGSGLRVAARVERLVLEPGARTPGLGPVSGVLLADERAAALSLASGSDWTFAYPHVFREPIRARVARGSLATWRGDDDRWHFGAADLALDGEGWSATLAGEFVAGTESGPPLLDVRADVHAGRVERARLFWPVHVMPPGTVRWLDRGLVAGEVVAGAAVFRGELRSMAMRDGGARLEAVAAVRDATLDYAPGWPTASIGAADLSFIDNGMWIGARDASVRGIAVGQATARIADFRDAELAIEVRDAAGTGADLLGFLRDSPLAERLGPALAGIELGGRGDLALRLDLPLKPGEIGRLALAGEVRLHEAALADRARGLDFGTTSGRVRFSEAGLVTDDLAVRFGGEPATFALAIGEFVADPRHVAEASVRGELPAAALLDRVPQAATLVPRVRGRTQWDLVLAIARDQSRADDVGARGGAQTLSIRSDLVGLALDLPAPLRKDAASALPFRLDWPLDGRGEGRIAFGRIARGRIAPARGDAPPAIAVGFGLAEPPEPSRPGLVIRGDVAALDAGGWLELVSALPRAAPAAQGLPLDIDVEAAEFALIGRAFPDTRVTVATGSGGSEVGFDGPAIAGAVRLPRDGAQDRRVVLDFDRLYLLDRIPGPDAEPTDPAAIPPLAIAARDFRLGAARLGSVTVETRPIEGGLAVERFAAISPELVLEGRGRWTGVGAAARSDFEVELGARSLGRMLDALGFVGVVDGGETRARLAGHWPGGPADLALARIDGELEARVERGRILEVEPGAGRILGLVSLTEIPRRLALDFSDFFQRGMAFDSIEGRFRLEGGDAFTDAIAIASPAADIVISGRTGLATRDYDQRLVVTPRVGGMLPIMGALAAGPAGAAVGVVAQGVLGPGIGRIAASNYRVTGSWDSPEIVPQRGARDAPPRS